MKSVPLAALALSLMATSAMAQPRHWRGEDGNNAPPPRVERQQPRPQAQPQAQPLAQPQQVAPQAQYQRGGGRWNREAQPSLQAAPQAQPNFAERRAYAGGRRFETPQSVQPQAQPQQRTWQGGQRRQFQGDPRQGGDPRWGGRDRGQSQAQPQQVAPSGQWDGRRDGGARQYDRQAGPAGRNGAWNGDRRGPSVRPSWATPNGRYDRDRNRPRYDVQRYPHFFNFGRHYRVAPYVYPFGFYDYSWGYGDTLPWGWYGPDYWIDDFWDYGLPPPPAGCEWVRVGSDALLIDTFDGRVLSVARALFW